MLFYSRISMHLLHLKLLKPCNDDALISYQTRGQSKVIISHYNLLVKIYNKDIQFNY